MWRVGVPWDYWPRYVAVAESLRLAILFNDVLFICVFWGLVNLLPVYPLDGGQIAREVLRAVLSARRRFGNRCCCRSSPRSQWPCTVTFDCISLTSRLFFGYLAYSSFIALQNYSRRQSLGDAIAAVCDDAIVSRTTFLAKDETNILPDYPLQEFREHGKTYRKRGGC